MALFNESWRKLRLLFEEEEDEAAVAEPADTQPAEATAAAPTSSAALRAEARRKRKLDMRERLAAMIQPDGSVKGGILKFVNLFPIAAHVGDRWPILVPKVELMAEAVIRREIDPWDLWAVHGDKGFALIFTDPNLTDEQANARCLRIFEAIREHLLGQVHIGRPRFDVDPRLMLRALDEDGEPPLVMDDPQPPGAWVPPAAELAARANYIPPGGGAATARSQGPAIVRSGEVTESAAAPIDWQPAPERAARDIAVDRTGDRARGTVDVAQTHEKAKREPEWVYATL